MEKFDKLYHEAVMYNTNLYNMVKGKTKAVNYYINELDILPSWDLKQREKFYTLKKHVQGLGTASQKLDAVGYRYGHRPEMYSQIVADEKKV